MPTHSPRPAAGAVTTGHLTFRPGVHVLRRDATSLQVGLDPARAVVLPDTPATRELLDALRSPAPTADPRSSDPGTLDLLSRSGLLVDTDRLLPLMPLRDAAGSGAPSRTGVAAVAAEAGDETATLLARRAACRVQVMLSGGCEVGTVGESVTELLRLAGVPYDMRAAGPGRGNEDREVVADDTVGLLVAVGEPDRDQLDPWLRAGTPHLLLRLVEGHAVVGPFVAPGTTACLRCIDAHHTDTDPAWPLLVKQYAAAVVRPRDDTLPEPADPALATLAAAWAARELVSHAEGRTPATSSTTVRLDPHLTCLETDCWPRHPACGCGWA
ncbi:MAG: hypothetical protein ACOYX5_00950 [Actinomycetota bacterium]